MIDVEAWQVWQDDLQQNNRSHLARPNLSHSSAHLQTGRTMAERPRGFAFDTGRRVRRPYANFPMIIESPWWPPLPPVGPVEPPIVPPPPVGPVEPPPIVTPPPKPTDRPLTLGNFIFHVNENGPAHHAEEFLENNVVRRGQPFSVGLLFDREVDLEKDKLLIEFQYGNNPLPSKDTLLRLPVGDALKEGEWSAAVEKADGQNVKVSITSPANAIVGRYHVVVETELAGERSRSRKVDIRNVVVLFNPWCKDDLTYLDDNTKLEEYVLNEYGCQFFGNYYRIGKRGWNFGQFEPGIPDVVLLLLEKSGLGPQSRGSAVSVSRAMSKLVNSADENGVLEGNWSGDYSWGTPPTGWNGSVDILRQWGTERRPVRYGQCWVFSGVLTTVLRCLGIPARSITNFQSAHDTDVSMTIDNYFNKLGYPVDSEDSVW
ncbi:protein-glutamine gamma-glutamyltransferase K-like [Branchiostoma floridae]|uniref:Protein-glutamine gamma-glutamyltransferase K-like n=1 Tax=Branchiostoma floridae TaxID=7739 RepID=A0A9J7L9G5_BRAFL|nr:protein-glutamine gamma-glutamyltransferase K-like [Branchiostoma floridae]